MKTPPELIQGSSTFEGSVGNDATDGAFGFLEWSVRSDMAGACDGADSYVVSEGKIVAQSIHYSIRPQS